MYLQLVMSEQQQARIALVGPPASGKSTIAEWLRQTHAFCKLTVGDEMRKAAAADGESNSPVVTDPETRRYLRGVLKSGGLLPDSVVTGIIHSRINSRECAKGFVLDGFPRNIGQAKELDRLLQAKDGRGLDDVVSLDVNDRMMLAERMAGRLVHASSGRTYHVR